MHLSGNGNSDDVTRSIEHGGCAYFRYDLPTDHMGGLHWYHAHKHPHVAAQVGGGAFGLIRVEELPLTETIAGVMTDAHRGVYEFLTDRTRELFLIAGMMDDNWVNANHNASAVYELEQDVWYRMRILSVDPSALPEQMVFPEACQVHALAHDGVYRFEVPKAAASVYPLTGASRLDVAIRCNSIGDHEITMSLDNARRRRKLETPAIVGMLNVTSSDGGTDLPGPFVDGAPWKSYRPFYLQDLRNETVDNTLTLDTTFFSINAAIFNPLCPLTNDDGSNFTFHSVQEWTYRNSANHPFHLHVYHMQARENCGAGHDAGEYYDTLGNADNSDDCVVRFVTADFGGRVMLHCHALDHEDQGAMAWINVEDAPVVTATTPCCLHGNCSDCVDELNLPNNCEGGTGVGGFLGGLLGGGGRR